MMQTALTVSTALLWVAVVALGAICLALVRQIGILYERIMPAGALMIDKGPAVGAIAPTFELTDIRGAQVKVGGFDASGKATLLFFLSPTCPVCKKLLPLLPSLQASEATPVNIVLASDGDADEHALRTQARPRALPVRAVAGNSASRTRSASCRTRCCSTKPARCARRETVNTREHLESLFEAKERGVASLQQFVHGDHGHDHDAHAQRMTGRPSFNVKGEQRHGPV